MKVRSPLLLSLSACALLAPSALAQTSPIPLQTINDQMNATAAKFPAIAKVYDLNATFGSPQTWQGRSIFAIKISDNVDQDEDEEAFLLVAAHHGNEYGTPFVALDAMTRLTLGYGTDPTITDIVDNHEIWIAPVWNVDGYPTSRHNRRPGSTVDLNRNYPFLWNSPCNSGVRGPAPGSEPETQTMIALSDAVRFTKVLDFHSSGREVLYDYHTSCPTHPLRAYLRAEAVAIGNQASYGTRGPSSNGEHYQWQLGTYSNYAFLTEIDSTQSPSYSRAVAEATRLWPLTLYMLQRPVPVWGHVTDANTGLPVEASITYVEVPFTQGERNPSEPRYGRYHAFLPTGNYTLRFSHPCYVTQDVPVTVTTTSTQIDVELVPRCASCLARNGSGINPTGFDCVTAPVLGMNWDSTIATTPQTTQTLLGLSGSAAQTPFLGGEVLIGLNPVFFQGGLGGHSVPIPNNPVLLGLSLATQGFRLEAARVPTLVMLNAQDLTLGIQLTKK